MNIEKSVTLSKPSSRATRSEVTTRSSAAESASSCRASFPASCAGVRTLLIVTRTGVCNPSLSMRATSMTFMPGLRR